jgi:hypothetical protein
MEKRKDLPIGMGTKTEAMIQELEFHFQVNGHDLVRKMIQQLNDPTIKDEFLEYNHLNKIKRIEKSSRIRGFKFKDKEIEEFIKMQWKCRIKGLSTFIKQLVYFNYEKFIEKIK